MMQEQKRGYFAYLLRLWHVHQQKGWSWRASLESPTSGNRLGFTSIDDLCAFLRRETLLSSTIPEVQLSDQDNPKLVEGDSK